MKSLKKKVKKSEKVRYKYRKLHQKKKIKNKKDTRRARITFSLRVQRERKRVGKETKGQPKGRGKTEKRRKREN